MRVGRERRWAALPTVTATGKPAVSPLVGALAGVGAGDEFSPQVKSSQDTLTTPRFRKLLEEAGYSVLNEEEIGAPEEPGAKAWSECGAFDRRGHDLGAGLAAGIGSELGLLVERVQKLLEAGWRSVRVVTDHGWLLMPDGFPKQDLPDYLVMSRLARCATIKGHSSVRVPQVPWHWNAAVEIATATGISCFTAGCEYAHGGVSLQECLLEELSGSSRKPPVRAKRSPSWWSPRFGFFSRKERRQESCLLCPSSTPVDVSSTWRIAMRSSGQWK